MPSSNSDARKRHEEAFSEVHPCVPRDGIFGEWHDDPVMGLTLAWEAAKAMETEVIGLSGWAQSGKDSTANVMVDTFGYERLSFADPLRAVARQSNPIVHVTGTEPFAGFSSLEHEHVEVEWAYEQDAECAYEWLKANTTYREFLQDLGLAVRKNLGEDTFVNAALAKAEPGHKYVVSDVRFQNEANAIRAAGGKVWRIQRAGHKPANDHISERDLDDYAFDSRISLPDFGDDLEQLYPAIAGMVGITFMDIER